MSDSQGTPGNEVAELLQQAFTCFQLGQLAEAETIAQELLGMYPNHVDANHLLGVIAGNRGEYDLADRLISRAINDSPDQQPMCHFNLGLAMYAGGRLRESLASFDQALQIAPDFAKAHFRRGVCLMGLGKMKEALVAYDHAIRIEPDFVEAYNNRGIILRKLGRPNAAVDSLCHALKLQPDMAEAYNNYGEVLREIGQPVEAEENYRRALELRPNYARAHSNLLFLLASCAELPCGEMLDAHRDWDRIHGEEGRLQTMPVRNLETRSGQRLKIGYVSPDLCMHAVSYFFGPLLAAHDRTQYEVYCYASLDQAHQDLTTERLRVLAEHWHYVGDMEDSELARLIRADGIDILVDLAGHTRGNRLKAFTYRPAPLQVTYLGYCTGTGLSSMDYWITDEVLHPLDTPEQAVEAIWRLPRCWVCYQAPLDAPQVAQRPPAQEQVMFGSFSNLAKLSENVISTWSELLHELPSSQLLLMDMPLAEIQTREQIQARFARYGISSNRLILQRGAPLAEYLATYAKVDIVLDTFPRTGGTTTAEALWMGLPVVTLAGQRYVERISASKLSAVGHEELIARNRQEYLEIALALANDPARRADLRGNLRDQLARSPLCDGVGLARVMEESYKSMWNQLQSR